MVAIKKFKQAEDEDPHVRKTMMREIKVLKEFRHQNIVNLRKVFRENGKLYLVFDYVQKTLLEELLSIKLTKSSSTLQFLRRPVEIFYPLIFRTGLKRIVAH